jgi:hypothetical protein
MSASAQKQLPQSSQIPALDLIVKYAVVLTWLVYAAGLTRISGFAHQLGVPTEPSLYAVPTVFSYGGYAILDLAGVVILALVFVIAFEKDAPRIAIYVGWSVPALFLFFTKYALWRTGPVPLSPEAS